MRKIEAKQAKYIKLGPEGSWERLCIGDGTLRLGYADVPHDLALKGDKEGIRQIYLDKGMMPGTATKHANQVLDFYQAGPETLWITMADGFVWWCFAQPGTEYLGLTNGEHEARGARLRRCVDGWHNQSIGGSPLRVRELSGRLTKVAAYRMTICKVDAFDFLLRKINDESLPEAEAARAVRQSILDSIQSLLKLLDWHDFELLVDLVFAHSGWRRTGETGGTQKAVDIELMLPSTGEAAFVQVKSRTNQSQLDDYVERLAARDESRMFYVYHSGSRGLSWDDPRVTVIGPQRLAEMVLNAGLFDWLLNKSV